MDTFIFVLEIIGTVAFASSGAMTAIEKKMDISGCRQLISRSEPDFGYIMLKKKVGQC